MLIAGSISKSTTQSLGRQYEIISLIVIRNVFKDIAEFDSFKIIQEQFGDFVNVLVDMGGGLVMFLMVAVLGSCNWLSSSFDRGEVSLKLSDPRIVRLIALAMAVVVYVFLWRTTLGYRIRAVGLNPDASRYAPGQQGGPS